MLANLVLGSLSKMRVTEPYTLFPRKLNSGKTVYYYQFRDEVGRRSVPKSTGCVTLSSARRFCQKLYNTGLLTKSTDFLFENYMQDFFSKDNEWYTIK